MENSPCFRYWGKAGNDVLGVHLLPYHGLDVAAVGDVLLRRDDSLRQRLADCVRLPEGPLVGLVSFFLAAHDLGKFSYRFQAKNPEAVRLLGREPFGIAAPTERHDRLGWRLWDESVRSLMEAGLLGEGRGRKWLQYWRAWGRAFLGHHGIPPDLSVSVAERPVSEDFRLEDQQAADAYLSEMAQLFDLPRLLSHLPETTTDVHGQESLERGSWFLAGLAILCDWLGSNKLSFPPEARSIPLADYWRERALPLAERSLASSGVLPQPVRRVEEPEQLLPHLEGQTLSPLQRAAWEAGSAPGGPRLLVFEDLTGSGKTEAAMLAAFGIMQQGLAQGVFFALPTQATSNAMYARIASLYPQLFQPGSRPSVVLAHGNREFSEAFVNSIEGTTGDAYDAQEDGRAWCSAWLADHRKRALLASVGVGTIDQALLGVLPSRHQSIRLLGVGRNVLVVDEVHAYDEYVTGLLDTLLRFQAAQGGSAILLSATLPQRLRQRLVAAYAAGSQRASTLPLVCGSTAFPLATQFSDDLRELALPARDGTQRRTEVQFFASEAEVLQRIDAATSAGGCVLWVRNTVNDAIAAYDQLVRPHGAERVTLFHARFAICDRAKREADVLAGFGPKSSSADRRGRIVVATQVAEQSLDVDFDLVVSDLAPIESLIQRAGRCMRHIRPDRPWAFTAPTLVLLAPRGDAPVEADWYAALLPGAARVYPFHGRLWLAASWLRERGCFRLPEDAREMLEFVYGEGADERVPPALREHDAKATEEVEEAASWAAHNALNLEVGYTASGNRWADDEETPTRLGEPTVTLRLCRVEGKRLVPWDTSGPVHLRWARSDVTVRQAAVATLDNGQVNGRWIAAAREEMSDGGRWSQLATVRPGPENSWIANGRTGLGKAVLICYTHEKGMWLERQAT